MKMLWFADSLSYKRNGKAITGLVYRVRQMGAVPEGSEQIIDLDGIEFETIYYEPDRLGYKFKPAAGFEIKELSKEDIEILDVVIAAVGHLNSQEIVDKMHEEDAYKYTENHSIITYHFAERLSLN